MNSALDAAPVMAALCTAPDSSREALLRLAADRIRAAGEPYTSVYLYMLHGDELILEAWSGRDTEHTRIPVGKGVCGSAVATGEDQNVGDVRSRGNYIACNLFTRSELVVLIRKQGEIIGQIDVDSDQVDPFTAAEVAAVRQVADLLGELL
ncbi:MAG TPA: GAF domain-containing protein [Gemmatimonadales bacterium]|nr:GAF domain-containing protein [Gemmatimonadales bacterium]